MSLLFEVTELDFKLNVENSSFLDETWTIPVSELLHVDRRDICQPLSLVCLPSLSQDPPPLWYCTRHTPSYTHSSHHTPPY